VATDHRVGGDAAAVAVTFDGFAQSATERNLVAVIRTLNRGVAAEFGALSFASRPEQCHREPPVVILPGFIPDEFNRL
jgi:hypothetical protein